jgi:hypothetical protein
MELYGREFEGTELIRMSSYKHTLEEVSFDVVISNTQRSYNAPGTRIPIDIEETFSAANHC